MVKRFASVLAIAALLLALWSAAALAATFAGRVELRVTGNYVSGDLATAKDRLEEVFSQLFTSGTASGQANLLWHDERTLTTGASEDLDLAGVLADAFGSTLTFAKVKALIIKNQSATQTLSIGGAASAQFINWVGDATDVVTIPPGGVLALYNPGGYAVTATTGDLLKVLNSAGASATYDIIVIGSTS